jgi:molybdopterin molybdotransferase
MITTAQATSAIAAAMPTFDSERVALPLACGRILREAVCAERDQPPFDRVTMDGIAIRFATLEAGNRRFVIKGTQHAGDPVQSLSDDDGCIEIMTGAVKPENTDCIIPVERITIDAGDAVVEEGYEARRNQFVHSQGSDHRLGHRVLEPGTRIEAMDIAIIASCGLESVNVARQPVIRVISTGNELVPPGQPVAGHQIRLSNGPAMVAMLSQNGFAKSGHDHLIDEPELLKKRIAAHLDEADVLIISGGVSMGKADFVPEVLADLGVELVFHKVSQRPGKPMWFGIGPNGQAVFALPGNPVSAIVCCRQYVLPALFRASDRRDPDSQFAVLGEALTFNPKLTCFLPVRLTSSAGGEVVATPVPTNTSGDFTALSGTDGYIELALERNEFVAGTVVPLHRWNNP